MNRRSFIKTGLIFIPTSTLIPVCLADRRRAQYAKQEAAGGACTTLTFDRSGAADSEFGFDAFYSYIAGSFTTGGSGFTACSAELLLYKTGTPTEDLQAKVYTRSGSNPGTLVGSGSATVSAATLTGTPAYIAFTGMSATLASATNYFLVLQASGAVNNVRWYGGTSAELTRSSLDGSAWDNTGPRSVDFKLYSA